MNIPEQTIKKAFESLGVFAPKKWKDYENASDYLYILNIMIDEYIDVGGIIGKNCSNETSDEELISIFNEEANFIGYEIEQINENDKTEDSEIKICLVRDEKTGYYHFIRQDNDETWSEKVSKDLPMKLDWEEDNEFYYSDFQKHWYFKLRVSNC